MDYLIYIGLSMYVAGIFIMIGVLLKAINGDSPFIVILSIVWPAVLLVYLGKVIAKDFGFDN